MNNPHPMIPYNVPTSQSCQAREGHVVGQSGMILPCLCVKCGAPVSEGARRSRKLYYYPSTLWLAILVLGVWAFLLYLMVRKPVDVNYALCPTCAAAQRRKRTGMYGLTGLAWTSMWLQLMMPGSTLFAGVFGMSVLGMIGLATVMRPPLRVRRHTKEEQFALEGAHPRVLARLSMGETRERFRRLEA